MRAECYKALHALIFILLLPSCYPAHDTFFEPSAASGKVRKAECRGKVGPPNTIDLDQHGIHFTVSTPSLSSTGDRVPLAFLLSIPEGVSVGFKSHELIVYADDKQAIVRADQLVMYRFRPKHEKVAMSILEGQTLRGGDSILYHMTFRLPVSGTEKFAIEIPALLVNDKEINLPTITFSLKSGWYMYPINC